MNRRAFTLIELLIVVGILAILALIALPNFLDAQVRTKVSRAKSDMRTVATALEFYATDNNKYVPNYDSGVYLPQPTSEARTYSALTTPIAYITAAPSDPFAPNSVAPQRGSYYEYYAEESVLLDTTYRQETLEHWLATGTKWLVTSLGPDRRIEHMGKNLDAVSNFLYDPTNGTVSFGDFGRSNVISSLPQ